MERNPILAEGVTIYVHPLNPQYSDLKYNLPQAIRYLCFQGESALTVKKGNPCFNAVVILINYTLSIFLIVFGFLHANECPGEKKLPLFMILLGINLLVKRLCNCQYDYKSAICNNNYENPYDDGEYEEYDVPPSHAYLKLVFLIAEFALLITLCVYAFGTQLTTKPEDHNLPNYCDNTMYLGAFWVSISGLIFYSLRLIRFCCVCP